MKEWTENINGLINLCNNTKGIRTELKKIQKFIRPEKSPLHLIKPNDTRWSSRFKAYERIYILKEIFSQNILTFKYLEINHFIKNKEFWSHLEKILEFLKYFKDLTDLLQKDSSTIYLVFLSFKKLNEAIRHSSFPDKNFIETALMILKNNWKKHVNVSLVYASTLLFQDMEFLNFDLEIVQDEQDSNERDH